MLGAEKRKPSGKPVQSLPYVLPFRKMCYRLLPTNMKVGEDTIPTLENFITAGRIAELRFVSQTRTRVPPSTGSRKASEDQLLQNPHRRPGRLGLLLPPGGNTQEGVLSGCSFLD